MAKKEQNKNEKKEELLGKIYQQSFNAPIKNEVNRAVFFFYLIVAIIAGFLAGFIQDAWFDNYYLPVYIPSQEVKQQNTKEILDLNFLLKESNNEFSQVAGELKSKLVGFYSGREGKVLEAIYLEKDFLGSGLVVTSDGWILTNQSVVKDDDFVVITDRKKILEPLKIIVDPFNQIALVKVDAQDLSPVKFADLDLVVPTQNLLVVRYTMQNHGSDILKTTIQKFAYHDQSRGRDFLLSTEKIDHYLKISSSLDLFYNGALLVNDRMEVVGLLFESGKEQIQLAVPSYYLSSTFNDFLFSSEEVSRADLGVHYVSLSEALGLSEEITEGNNQGAVLLGDSEGKIPAVVVGSPAEKAGLKAGDIILKVNNEEVNERNSLTKIINDYTPGKELVLSVKRDGQAEEIKVVLGQL